MTVCILSFNHPQLTAKCVESVLNFVETQNVILTHNGSRAENILQLKKLFPQIEHFVINENKGYTGGVNASLKYAFSQNPWVFLVTNDCLLLNAPTHPELPGIYAPTLYRRNIHKIDSLGGVFYPLKGHLRHIRDLHEITKTKRYRNISFLNRYFYVPGTAFYIDHATFNKVGTFDESLHTYWEDVDYSVRAQKLNVNVSTHLETKLIHKIGKTCHKDKFYTNTLFKRNRKTISQKYTPAILHPLQKFIFSS